MRMSLATKFSLKPFAKSNSGLAPTETNSTANTGTQPSFGPSNSNNESSSTTASSANDTTASSLFPPTTSRSPNQNDLIGASFAVKQSPCTPEPRQNDKPSLSPTLSTFQPQGFGQGRLFGGQDEGQSNSLRLAHLPSKKMFAAPSMTHSNSSSNQASSSGTAMEISHSFSFPTTPTNSIANEIRSRATAMAAASNSSSNNNNERSLVLLPQQASGGYGSTTISAQEDPFAEVTRTIHSQNRKIRELELQLKEQVTISDQLRARIDDSQEVSKKAEEELATLRDKVARSENTLSHKEVEMNELRTRIDQLEADKFRMMNENEVLSKTIEDQKKRFIAELKKSTDTILVLQNIRSNTSSPTARIPSQEMKVQEEKEIEEKINEMEQPKQVFAHQDVNATQTRADDANQTVPTHNNEQRNEEDKLKINMLEQALIEAENNFEDLKRWYSIAAEIIGQCESCSFKFNQEQETIQHDGVQQPKGEASDQVQSEDKMEVETTA